MSRSAVPFLVVLGATAMVVASGCAGCSKKKTPQQHLPKVEQPTLPAAQAPGKQTMVPIATSNVVRVPHTSTPPKIDGNIVEFNDAARSGWFVGPDGIESHPMSEARFMWDDKNLYFGLYAADVDIECRVKEHDAPFGSDDAFRMHVATLEDPKHPYSIDINALGTVADAKTLDDGKLDYSWESHLDVKVDIDEDQTINNPADDDEEWVVEGALPWSSIGVVPKPGTVITIDLKRCDTPRGGATVCGTFGQAADGSRAGRLELLAP